MPGVCVVVCIYSTVKYNSTCQEYVSSFAFYLFSIFLIYLITWIEVPFLDIAVGFV
jgi:hypothetical protein